MMAQATINFEDNIFERLNEWIRGFEGSAVNFASALAPWLAPLTPAYMTFQHSRTILEFDWWIAFVNAAVVELLGLSAVNTGLNFYFYNRRNKAASKQAPLGIVIFSFLFYLFVIVSSNILLDSFADNVFALKWSVIAVRAGFALQTIPAALIIVARTGHKDMLNEMANEKAIAKANARENERLANEQERRTNEPVRSQGTNERTNDAEANERANEILAVMDTLWRETNGQGFSQADICRRVQWERTGSEKGFETLKSYVNKVAKTWSPPS